MVGGRLSGKTGGGLTVSGATESSVDDSTLSPAAPLPDAPTVDTVVSAPFNFFDNSNIGTEMPPIPIGTEGEELFSTPLKDGAFISAPGSDLMVTFLGFLVISAVVDLAFEVGFTRTLAPVIVEAVEEDVAVVEKRAR